MSCYFQVADDDVWNPSNSLARAFLGQATVLSQLVGVETGLGEIIEDECQIDTETFTAFVNALVSAYQESNNDALRSLLKGFTSVSLVLTDRIGAEVPSLKSPYVDMWTAEREALAKSMPLG
ncbi:DUF6086 family protein [Streptomyces sp. CB03238]|uniref:DUF6086 family protein n=1 Tax=Streptomyces sp. CB03238 TaxID=1907777 RepID=UPI000A0FF973|nr:DUF6086 family protein [Streptomyces sp. CB03238]ORT57949.1 hypothetical protein BKD26_22640 [Streptomyces sp. CB03238]